MAGTSVSEALHHGQYKRERGTAPWPYKRVGALVPTVSEALHHGRYKRVGTLVCCKVNVGLMCCVTQHSRHP